jgi:hypothetical protein
VRWSNTKATAANGPSVPHTLDLFAAGGVFFESIDLVADLERDDVPMDEILFCRRFCDCGKPVAGGKAGVATG